MRTPILAAALALSLVGCLIGDSGTTGTGGDDGTGGTGGTGTTDPGSGGTTTPPGTGTTTNPGPTPTVTAAIDKSTVATALGKTEVVTLTLTSGGSFAGDVTVAPSLVDSAGAALADGITVAGQPTVTLAANGMATAAYTVTIPSNATGADLAATLKLDVSSSAGTKELTSALSVAAVYTFTYAAGLAGDVANHPGRALNLTIKKGAKIEFHNADTTVHITHGQDGANGGGKTPNFPHESTTVGVGGQPGATYVMDMANVAVGATGIVGCHSHGNGTYANITVD